MPRGNKAKAWSYDDYVREYEKLKDKLYDLEKDHKKLLDSLIKAMSQNYCKICGNILDGYKPSRKVNEDMKEKVANNE